MDCPEIRERVSATLDDALSETDERLVREHLSSCESCRAYLEELKRGRALLDKLVPVEPPPWLTQKIMARVQQEGGRETHGLLSWLFRPLKVRIPLQAFGLALVIGLAVLLYRANAPEYEQVQTHAGRAEPRSLERPVDRPGTAPSGTTGVDGTERKVPPPQTLRKHATPPGPEHARSAVGVPPKQPEQTKAPSAHPEAAQPSSPPVTPGEQTAYPPAPTVKRREMPLKPAHPDMSRDGDIKGFMSTEHSAPVSQKSAAATRLVLAVKAREVEATAREIEELLKERGTIDLVRTCRSGTCNIRSRVTSDGIVQVLAELRDRFGTVPPGQSPGNGSPVILTIEITTP